jgi:hypothetical protein
VHVFSNPAASREDIDIAEVKAPGEEDSSDSGSDYEQTLAGHVKKTKPASKRRKIDTESNASAGPPPPGPSTQIFQSAMTRPSPWDRHPESTPDPARDTVPWPIVQFVTGERVLMIPHEFEEQVFARGRVRTLATRSAVPLILAWALSGESQVAEEDTCGGDGS